MTTPGAGRIEHLPPPDRITSGQTGWTRQHWIALADHLLTALRPYDSPLGARIDLPGRASRSGPDSDGLEGFARSSLLAACRIAATDGEGCQDLIDRYACGLAAGADRASPEAWPRITSRTQPMVEASLLAIALNESRPWLWDRLDERTRGHVVDWLSGFIGSHTGDNNWMLFQSAGEEFLASVGADHDRSEIDRGLDRLDRWSRGDGWYSDGDGQNFDHYNSFVLHSYPILWARMAVRSGVDGVEDRLVTWRERLHQFIEQFQHLIGPSGAPVMQGRSMTYRMAVVAPLWTGALAGATPLRPGQTRRLCSSVARHFVEQGVPDEHGLLSLGWYHHHLPMTQAYSGPGSPYWASLGFLGLLLPAEDPVWTEPEATVDGDTTDRVTSCPAPGFLVHNTHHDGVVRLVNHGSDHLGAVPTEPAGSGPAAAEPVADPSYSRYAYSNRTGPEYVPADAVDQAIQLVTAEGAASRRGRIHRLGQGPDHASSWSPAVWQSDPALVEDLDPVPLEVTSIVHGAYELRCVRIAPGATIASGAAVRFAAGAAALAATTAPDTATGVDADGRPWALATREDGLTSAIWGLSGCTGAEIRTGLGANPYGPSSATPVVTGEVGTAPVVVLVALTGDQVWPEAVAEAVELTVTPQLLRVRLPAAPREHAVHWDADGPRVTRSDAPCP